MSHFCATTGFSFGRSGNDFLRKVVQICLQVLDAFKFFECAALQCDQAGAGRISQSLQSAGVLSLPLFDQPQSVAPNSTLKSLANLGKKINVL